MNQSDPRDRGGCGCGGVTFVTRVHSQDIGHCTCRMCQRFVGALVVTWATHAPADVELGGDSLRWHASSALAERGFCATCGCSVAMRDRAGTWIDLAVATFDDPVSHPPRYLIWKRSCPPWLSVDPHLPHHDEGGPDSSSDPAQ